MAAAQEVQSPGTDHDWVRRYGPWAVVTGASDGIGRAMARLLAQRGLGVVLVARRAEILEQAAADARLHGVEARVVLADLAHADGIATVQRTTAELDVGLLVAAAGYGTSGPFVESALDAELDMLDVNCRAVLALTHHYAQRLVQRRRGGIILFGSIVGFQGTPYAANYAATKAYVQSLAEGLGVELAPFDVDVLASAPGPTNSGFASRAGMRMGKALDAETVALATLAALGHSSTVLPGLLTKVLTWSLAPLPRRARVRIMGRVMAGMTPRPALR